MTEVGEWIRRRRSDAGLSTADLAAAVGVDAAEVEAWESGASSPNARVLEQVQQALERDDARPEWWGEAMRLKDEMPLRELADHLGVSAGALSKELRKAGVRRRLRMDRENATQSNGSSMSNSSSPSRRQGSKDTQIEQYYHLLGSIPDSEVARLAEVSVRTVASYRARNDIPGYSGPRRRPQARGGRQSKLDDYAHLLGKLPDRVVAEEAGMSLGAVRNYRIKNDIPAAGRMPRAEINRMLAELRSLTPAEDESKPTAPYRVPAPVAAPVARPEPLPLAAEPAPVRHMTLESHQRAWRFVVADSEQSFIVVAPTLVDAVQRAAAAGSDEGHIDRIESLGTVLTAQS